MAGIVPRVRVWNDPYPYKKVFVLYGFDVLRRRGAIRLELDDYEAFERRGAPPRIEPATAAGVAWNLPRRCRRA